jgi:ankyrin repeat protein
MIKDYLISEDDECGTAYVDADVDDPRDMRSNLFISQCRNGNFESARLIYECYPNVIKYNWAIVWACEGGFMEIAKWLYEKRDEYYQYYPLYIMEYAFMWSCMTGKLDIIKWIYSVKPEININADCGDNDDGGFENSDVNGFTMACTNGKLDVAKWLLEIDPIKTLSGIDEFDTFALVCKERKYQNDITGESYDPILVLKWLLEIKPDINISKYNEMAFYYTCVYENIDTAKWLLEIKPDINISIDNDFIFRKSSPNSKIIKWLLEIKPDINIEANSHEAFKNACDGNDMEAVKFLISLNPEKYFAKFTKYGSVESWKIKINYIRKKTVEIKLDDIQECPICMDKNSQVITNCKHPYCVKCIKKVCEIENKCPTCRSTITDMYPFKILKN